MSQLPPDNGLDTDDIDNSINSFIVKIWLEETDEESAQRIWRGHITHVPSGDRRYIKELGEILVFIAPYIELLGM